MNSQFTFRAVIENAGGGGAFVRIPFDVEKIFGKKRVPIQVAIDGESYRGTLVRMGEPCHLLIILKDIRQKIGKSIGDEVEVTLEEDLAPHQVELPDDFRKALERDPQAMAVFQKMSYTHQKEYVNAIVEAKRNETRVNLINKTIATLRTK